eukprot:ctg_2339.g435
MTAATSTLPHSLNWQHHQVVLRFTLPPNTPESAIDAQATDRRFTLRLTSQPSTPPVRVQLPEHVRINPASCECVYLRKTGALRLCFARRRRQQGNPPPRTAGNVVQDGTRGPEDQPTSAPVWRRLVRKYVADRRTRLSILQTLKARSRRHAGGSAALLDLVVTQVAQHTDSDVETIRRDAQQALRESSTTRPRFFKAPAERDDAAPWRALAEQLGAKADAHLRETRQQLTAKEKHLLERGEERRARKLERMQRQAQIAGATAAAAHRKRHHAEVQVAPAAIVADASRPPKRSVRFRLPADRCSPPHRHAT